MNMPVLVLAGAISLTLLAGCGPSDAKKDALVTINDRVITRAEFEETLKEQGAGRTREELLRHLDRAIAKELFIQEAIRRGLDREESFRKGLKNFYEQNLIKSLTRTLATEAEVSISEEALREAYARMGRILHLKAETLNETGGVLEAKDLEVRFGDLPETLERVAFSLRPGVPSPPVQSGHVTVRLTLLGERGADPMPLESIRKDLETLLRARTQARLLDSRLKEFREKARVHVDEGKLDSLEVKNG